MAMKSLGNSQARYNAVWEQTAKGAASGVPLPSPDGGHDATGGTTADYTDPGPGYGYRSHTFLTSGSFVINSLLSQENGGSFSASSKAIFCFLPPPSPLLSICHLAKFFQPPRVELGATSL